MNNKRLEIKMNLLLNDIESIFDDLKSEIARLEDEVGEGEERIDELESELGDAEDKIYELEQKS